MSIEQEAQYIREEEIKDMTENNPEAKLVKCTDYSDRRMYIFLGKEIEEDEKEEEIPTISGTE